MKIKQNFIGSLFSGFNFGSIFALYFSLAYLKDLWDYDASLSIIIYLVFIALIIISIILNYIYFYITLEDDHLVISKGVIFKSHRSILYTNVSTISQKQNILLQVINCFKINIETNDTLPNSKNIILSYNDLNILNNSINQYQDNLSVDELYEPGGYTFKLSYFDLFRYTLAHSNMFKVFTILAFVYSFGAVLINDVFNTLDVEELTNNIIKSSAQQTMIIIIGLVILFIFSVFINYILTIIKYYNFTIINNKTNYQINYGLFNKSSYKIEKKYINGLLFKENFIDAFLGITRIDIINAGYGGNSDQDANSDNNNFNNRAIFILAISNKRKKIFLEEMMPAYSGNVSDYTINTKALAINNILLPYIIITTIVSLILLSLNTDALIIFAFIIFFGGLNLISFILQSLYQSIGISNNFLYATTFNYLTFTKCSYIIKKNKILVLTFNQGPLTRLYKSGRLMINNFTDSPLSAHINLRYISKEYFNYLSNKLVNKE